MKAFTVRKYGKNEYLHPAELPEPSIASDEVLIEIRAAGLNLLDHKILTGEFKLILPYKPPFVLGHDLAGVVQQVGDRVTRFKVGDEVISRPADHRIGTFAEYLAVKESDIAGKPANLSMEEAAGLPLVALTAWQVLVEVGKLKKGQKVFIQAGSGGVGLIAIQLAKHLGATVATTASKSSFDLLRSLGADVLIDYKTQDFETVLSDYDLVLNSQDNKTLEKSLNVVRKGGTVVSISGPPTPAFARNIGASWIVKLATTLLSDGIRGKAKKKGVNYAFLFMHSSGSQLAEIVKLVETGVLKIVLDRTYPMSDINEALDYVAGGRAKGKVVVTMK